MSPDSAAHPSSSSAQRGRTPSVRPLARASRRTRALAPRLERCEPRLLPASFALSKLLLGSATGPQDYLFTAGNKIVPQGRVDAGKYYDIVVTDPNGLQRTVVPRTPTSSFATQDNSYTILPTDPASNANYWKFTLREFASATTNTVLKSATKTFDVAQLTIYGDAGLTKLQSNLGAGATAYIKVAGLQPGKSDWSTTWGLPDGTVAAANTSNNDRPDSNASGVLAVGTTNTSAATFLQYPLRTTSTGTDPWNWV